MRALSSGRDGRTLWRVECGQSPRIRRSPLRGVGRVPGKNPLGTPSGNFDRDRSRLRLRRAVRLLASCTFTTLVERCARRGQTPRPTFSCRLRRSSPAHTPRARAYSREDYPLRAAAAAATAERYRREPCRRRSCGHRRERGSQRKRPARQRVLMAVRRRAGEFSTVRRRAATCVEQLRACVSHRCFQRWRRR